ncbi:hypothetical protein WA588_004577 [Blastocystis sp. NMH]
MESSAQPIWKTREIPRVDDVDAIQIKAYSPEYYDGVANLYYRTYLDLATSNSSIRKYVKNSLKSTFSSGLHQIKKPTVSYLWVAINSVGEVIGMGGIRFIAADRFEIQKLAVFPSYRRMGVSKRIWEQLMEEGSRLCPDRPLTVCLSTLSLLSVAEDYYTKMGFHLKRKDYFSGYDLDVFEKQIE